MSGAQRSELERFRYWQGQTLRSRDFRDQTNMEAQLRYWHNRALHNAYGVSFGLEVTAVREKAGDETSPLVAVSVACGLAYDCFGRELLLASSRTEKIPAGPEQVNPLLVAPERPQEKKETSMTLVARYKESAARCCSSANETASACWPGNGSALTDELELFWKASERVGFKDGVPLAKVDYPINEPSRLDQKFVIQRARALARPRTASGATIPGNTPWDRWEVDVLQPGENTENSFVGGEMEKILIGMQTTIDTSAAGFTQTPCYFAWLEARHPERGVQGFTPAFFASITDDTVDGFTFRLMMPPLVRQTFTAIGQPEVIRDATTVGMSLSMTLDSVAGLTPGSEIILNDPSTSAPPVHATVRNVGYAKNTVQLILPHEASTVPASGNMTVSSQFNESFRTRFLSYARAQELYVCWLGLQPDSRTEINCLERTRVSCCAGK